ncbi:MAG: nuclear transport factor 2 family protein [Acidimicrobiia bacterium]
MNASEIITMFGSVEDDQKYTRLVSLFTDDAVYYDPFAGAQVGRSAIHEFMAEMERVIPAMGVYFSNWETRADSHVGWSRWEMVVPVNGVEHPIPGQSLYRLRDGKVCFVADYVDPVAYGRIRPDRRPNAAAAAAVPKGTSAVGAASSAVRALWVERERSWSPVTGGVVTVGDVAVEDSTAWAQWSCVIDGRHVAGWTLHTISNGVVSCDDYLAG